MWTPSWLPVKADLDYFETRHGLGYTQITGERGGVRVESLYFVPVDVNAEVQKVTVTNTSDGAKSQLAPLSADGTELTAEPTRLVEQDQPWEGDLVEAPTLIEREGTYVLLYSANDYGGWGYAIGYATAPAVTGPYTKNPEPLFTTNTFDAMYLGPGGQDVAVGPDGTDRLVFHSWYGQDTYRAMNVLPLGWSDGRPVVEAPAAAS